MFKLKFTMTNKQNKIFIIEKENTRAFLAVIPIATDRFIFFHGHYKREVN